MENQGTNRRDLQDAVLEYAQDMSAQFMASEVLPVYLVMDAKGEFDKVAVAEAKKSAGNLKRGRKAAFAEIEHVTTSDTYACIEYALKEGIDLHQDLQALDMLGEEIDISNLLVLHLLRAYEQRVAAQLFNATTFAGFTGAVGTEWTGAGNPVEDIQDAKLTLLQQLGGVIAPGSELCLTVSDKVRKTLIQNSNVQALLSGGNGAESARNLNPADDQLASILDIGRFQHSPAQVDGVDIWDDEYALLHIRRTDQRLKSGVQLGRTFTISDQVSNPTESQPWSAKTWEMEDPPVRNVGVWHSTDEKVLTEEAGYLLSNISA